MNKQTVGNIYEQKQLIKGKHVESGDVRQLILTPEKENSQQLINIIKQALQEANQAVLQTQASYPLEENIAYAKNCLNIAIQKLQQLETVGTSQIFTKGANQQLKRLGYQIETAQGTLELLEQAIK